jgi:hypothetical protein
MKNKNRKWGSGRPHQYSVTMDWHFMMMLPSNWKKPILEFIEVSCKDNKHKKTIGEVIRDALVEYFKNTNVDLE